LKKLKKDKKSVRTKGAAATKGSDAHEVTDVAVPAVHNEACKVPKRKAKTDEKQVTKKSRNLVEDVRFASE
jgi:hypothetical protein